MSNRRRRRFTFGVAGRPHQGYALLTLAIVISAVSSVILSLASKHDDPILPNEFRIAQTNLSRLPVQIDRVRSCSCWRGPRNQAQRKFKFGIVNGLESTLNVGGGRRSALRLLVAYPNATPPQLSIPVARGDARLATAESPPDIDITVTTHFHSITAEHVELDKAELAVPRRYSVWALPPTPNKLAEPVDDEVTSDSAEINASFPTVVDKTELLPGERYESSKLGHGTWTFYIPLDPKFHQSLSDSSYDVVLPPEQLEPHVIIIGIAALRLEEDSVRMVGFAPAPSDDALAYPEEL